MRKRDWFILGGFSVLVFALRFAAFFRAVYDWDESLFLLMGRSLLRGEVPYTAVWEHSPPGLPVLFALGQALFGYSVVSIRVLTCLAVIAECVLLYRLGGVVGQPGTGLIAGLLYALFSLNNGGLAAQRELFFAPCVTLALYLILLRRDLATGSLRINGLLLLVVGLLLGLGLQLKYLYAIDIVGVFVVVLLKLVTERADGWRQTLAGVAKYWGILAIGPLLFVAVSAVLFFLNGHLADYLYANFRAAAAYAGNEPLSLSLVARTMIWQMVANFLPWLGLLSLPLYLAFVAGVSREERRNLVLMSVWFAFALTGALFSRKLFTHYFLQVLPPLCILCGALVAGLVGAASKLDVARRSLIVGIVLSQPFIALGYPTLSENAGIALRLYLRGVPAPVDTPAVVASYLRPRVDRNQTIYVVDYEPILYYLVDARLPTKFIFPPFLVESATQGIGGVNQVAELQAIMGTRPQYVIRQSPANAVLTNALFAAAVESALAQEYVLEETVQGADTFTGAPISVEIHRRV